MNVILILPYFGKLPNYFNLFLKSVKYNNNIKWLLITDDKSFYEFPTNLEVKYVSFKEIQDLFQSKFDFKIKLDSTSKLCDFKPTYGYMFENYTEGYAYWGHCDLDIIWGNFNKILDLKKLNKYDKIFNFGHLTIYKNEPHINKRFFELIDAQPRYKIVFSQPIGFAFDEKYNKSINSIYRENNFSIFQNSYVADIDPYHYNFRLTIYNFITDSYSIEGISKQLFTWEEGNVYRYYKKNDNLIKEEFLYIHLQKRKMKIRFDFLNFPKILITPNEFIPLFEEINYNNFDKYYKKKYINFQYLKVKWNSLKYKFKYLKYFYGNKKSV